MSSVGTVVLEMSASLQRTADALGVGHYLLPASIISVLGLSLYLVSRPTRVIVVDSSAVDYESVDESSQSADGSDTDTTTTTTSASYSYSYDTSTSSDSELPEIDTMPSVAQSSMPASMSLDGTDRLPPLSVELLNVDTPHYC
jgi:hypothetical protein